MLSATKVRTPLNPFVFCRAKSMKVITAPVARQVGKSQPDSSAIAPEIMGDTSTASSNAELPPIMPVMSQPMTHAKEATAMKIMPARPIMMSAGTLPGGSAVLSCHNWNGSTEFASVSPGRAGKTPDTPPFAAHAAPANQVRPKVKPKTLNARRALGGIAAHAMPRGVTAHRAARTRRIGFVMNRRPEVSFWRRFCIFHFIISLHIQGHLGQRARRTLSSWRPWRFGSARRVPSEPSGRFR